MKWYSEKISTLFSHFYSDEKGLSLQIVTQNAERFGRNQLPQKKKSRLKMMLVQFQSPLVIILIAAIAISLGISFAENGTLTAHNFIEPGAIFVILLLNALFGFFQELKAEDTLAALENMTPARSTVLRNGKKQEIETRKIVAGDIVFLAEGDTVPADIRLLEAAELRVSEALLTGESETVRKNTVALSEKVSLGDQKNMLFSGTQIVSGRGRGLVVAVGTHTELGKIATMVMEAQVPKTPLEKRLDKLGKKIGLLVIGVCVIVFFLALLQKDISLTNALLVAVALAVGAVPEGLPAVMTISLSVGVAVMARKKALVRELRAVETLGSVTVIASDKTGTMTENKMTVVATFCAGKHFLREELQKFSHHKMAQKMLRAAALCNDATLPDLGDPTEIGLLQIAEDFGFQTGERIAEIPFSSERKWMSTTHSLAGKTVEIRKGAPEMIAEFCPQETKEILLAAEKMASRGLRPIAVCEKYDAETEMTFLGIFGLLDPPRKTVAKAIKTAQRAGIQTIMITGDHLITATAIAKKIGLIGEAKSGAEIEKSSEQELQKIVKTTQIFARVSPQHKVRICRALQKNGEVVAMTGDGVNDAPAIRQSDVGISMGKMGTSVAQSASNLVLLDDHYATIVRGVEEGRRIFANIKKSIIFLLRTNMSEVLLIIAAMALFLPLPLLPIHLLFLNLLTDSFPALALAAEPADGGNMRKKPRPLSEGFLHGQMQKIILLGAVGASIVLFVFWFSLEKMTITQSQTLALATIIFGELSVIFSIRRDDFFWKKATTGNPWVFRATVLALAIFFFALFSPLSSVLRLSVFPLLFWAGPASAAILLFAASEGMKRKGH